MNENESMIRVEPQPTTTPAFVEIEKMLDKLSAITKETAAKAYDFFVQRGSQLGSHMEDWLRAESETLRTAPVKITESKDLVNVVVAVPGYKASDIEVSIKDDLLIVTGETTTEDEKDGENTFYSEWRSDRFLRKLTLPSQVQTENVAASLKDGVLTLSLKKRASEEATKVAIKTA